MKTLASILFSLLTPLWLSSCTDYDLSANSLGLTPGSSGKNILSGEAEKKPSKASIESLRAGIVQSNELNFESAIRSALAWYPSVDQAVANIDRSKTEIVQARTGYLPRVSAGVNTNLLSSTERLRPAATVKATQMVYDFGKTAGNIATKAARTRVSRTELLVAVDSLILDTGSAVNELQRYASLKVVAQAQLESVKAITDQVKERTAKGASTMSDEVQAEARYAAAESTLIDVTGNYEIWKARLSALTGIGKLPKIKDVTPEWVMNACSVVEPDWSQVSAVARAEAQKVEAEESLKLAKVRRYPTINLEGQVSQDLLRRGTSGQNDLQYKVGLNFDGDLFDGGFQAAGNKIADAELKSADAASRFRRIEASNAMTQARMSAKNLQVSIKNKSSRKGLMEQTRDLYQQQYLELGTRTLLDLLNSVQELHGVEFDIVNARHDIRKHGLECAINSGKIRNYLSLQGAAIRGVTL